MKKLLLLFVAALTLASCDNDDDNLSYTDQFLPTASAIVPAEIKFDTKTLITITYEEPSSCYTYDSLSFLKSTEVIDNENGEPILTQIRTISVINRVNQDNECADYESENYPKLTTAEFNFSETESGPYLFKFWAGFDENGKDTYLEYETIVLAEGE
ncbi:hypothetical protein [Formosa sp. PL04]|uniref:hypothetical protein n=1 Tax=Formosa sp. PL04 TaxID=3081755 RepID=UPI0029820CB2|nr:hypothetical protein [Formosa sp. PL04]MDW5289049.1 hypothetical protein [Formosa sp. PL04]